VNAAPPQSSLSATVGLLPDLKYPNFGDVAKAVGLWGHMVSEAGELEKSVQTWLAQPGLALHVEMKPMQLVTPPSPFVSPEPSSGWRSTAPGHCYSAMAATSGK
jgi:hypothetical protein